MLELIAFSKWILMCFMVSCFMRPFLHLKNLDFFDGGFSLSMGFGTALSFFTTWFISAVTPVKFDTPACLGSVLAFLLVGSVMKIITGKGKTDPKDIYFFEEEKVKKILVGFALFVLLFSIAAWVRGFKPEISCDTEKYMDFGFLQGIYRQKKAIPEDIWFGGKTLNYYYFGQAATVFLCRLAFITPDYGYNFMICTIFALTFCMTFSLIDAFVRKAFLAGKNQSVIGGLCGAVLTCFGGNGHYLIYGVILPICEKITGKSYKYNDYGYFFPDSTVYIGMYPETFDKGKHEFLSYTLILGDLHAHAINIIFVLPLIAVLLDYSLDESDEIKLYDVRIFMLAFLLGLFRGTNYWDFAIYFVVAGAVILFCDYSKNGVSIITTVKTLMKGIIILVLGTLIMLPFSMHFEKMILGIYPVENNSPLYKLIIIWGIHVLTVIVFLICLLLDGKKRRREYEIGDVQKNKISKVIKLNGSEPSMVAIILCGIGLIAIPEIIYVKDIYGIEYARFNTMFKLTYQAFTLLSICTGVFVGYLMSKQKNIAGYILIGVTLILSTYGLVATRQYIGNVFLAENRKGCSVLEAFYDVSNFDSMAETNAVKIINDDKSEKVHIMEKFGHSYSPECKISVFTGASNVAGWEVHEWMWRNNWDIVAQRENEIACFYTCGDEKYCDDIIEKYDLDYIFVGPAEVEAFDIRAEGFAKSCHWMPLSGNPEYALYKVIK